MVTVLIIDDDRAMRMELSARLLSHSCAIRWLGHDAEPSALEHLDIDVLVVNLAATSPEQQLGIERLCGLISCARSIVIVDDLASPGPRRAMERGAYVIRNHPAMAEQVAALILGRASSPPSAAPVRPARETGAARPWGAGALEVSARELQVIEGVKHGHTNQRIAAELGTSEQQVKNILSRLYKRYRIKNRVSLINLVRTHEASAS